MNLKTLKMKDFVMKKYTLIVLTIVILFIASTIWGCFAYPRETYENEEFIASQYNQCAEYSYYAMVTQSNPVYPKGLALNEAYPAYFYTVSPSANIIFSYGIEASDSAEIDVDITSKIMMTAISRTKNEDPFWEKAYSVNKLDTFTLRNNETYTHDFVLYAKDIEETVDEVKKHLEFSQKASANIITQVTTKGSMNGKNIETYEEYVLPVAIESSFYQLPGGVIVEDITETVGLRRVLVQPKTIDKILPIGLPLLFLIMIIGFYVYQKYYFTEIDQNIIVQMEIEKEHESFSDWISKGILPSEFQSLSFVEIKGLTDLVNLSIDSGTRVIFDKESGVYFSVISNILYVYYL